MDFNEKKNDNNNLFECAEATEKNYGDIHSQ